MTDQQSQAYRDITYFHHRLGLATKPQCDLLAGDKLVQLQTGIRRVETIAGWSDAQLDRWVDHIFQTGLQYDWDHAQTPLQIGT